MRSGEQGIYSGVRCRDPARPSPGQPQSCPATVPPAENAQEPAAEGSGSQQPTPLGKSQEKTALFITKFPNTYSDLVWPLSVLLGEV